MKISKQVLSNIFEAAGDFDDANRYADSARKALEAGTLEIEGYERVQWTKFDLRDQKTFPPHDKIVVIALRDGHVGTAFVRWICNWCEFAGYSRHDVTHWRPLPQPPGKEANDD